MPGKFKLKALAGMLSVKSGDEELGSWPLNLIPTYENGKSVWASGQVVDPLRGPVMTVNVSGVSIDDWPKTRSPGRPSAEEKHLAVLLAWALEAAKLGGKATLADDETAKLFDYSEGKKVRDIRIKLAKSFGIDLDNDALYVTDRTLDGDRLMASVLIARPTYYRIDPKGLEVLGNGIAWHENLNCQILRGAMRVVVPELESTSGIDHIISKKGPIIVSVIRPGS